MSQSQPIPGKGKMTREQEITYLMQQLQSKYDFQVGSPDSADHEKEAARQILNTLVAASSPFSRHTSSEVTQAIEKARKFVEQ